MRRLQANTGGDDSLCIDSLDEVLEIDLPNLQFNLHHCEQHLGLRGIIRDREANTCCW